jgi:hypothetical protein
MATRSAQTVPAWVLIAFGAICAGCVMALLHDGHYRERRLQLIEHDLEALRGIVTGKHGRTV